jgi:hypothetical protein
MKKDYKEKEYERRIGITTNAIFRAAKMAGFQAEATMEYQGCEIPVFNKTDTDAKVIVLMVMGYKGHGPRFPKNITLTVHGTIHREINQKLIISTGGIGAGTKKFLPESISKKWLAESISDVAEKLREICTAENMETIEKEARKSRREKLREDDSLRNQTTFFNILKKKTRV